MRRVLLLSTLSTLCSLAEAYILCVDAARLRVADADSSIFLKDPRPDAFATIYVPSAAKCETDTVPK